MIASTLGRGFLRATFSLIIVGLLVTAAAQARAQVAVKGVLKNYADIAHAGYEDSLLTAQKLQTAIEAFLAKPNDKTHLAAKNAWIAARVPYQQTEAYRFGNPVVDDWEGKVNAWPLDEGLIDYVAKSYGTESDENELYVANVIASSDIKIGGQKIDVPKITKSLLKKVLHEAGEIEANVATGYHAVEFLLWGQDLNGTDAGAGKRPPTDYDLKNCTNGNCARRAEYLRVVTDLLIDDLKWIVAQWAPDGPARKELLAGPEAAGLTRIFTGLGSLSYGELAGERMQLGLLINDPEEEHDCFSDNTHNSHYYDQLGIQNVYLGRYKRVDGSTVSGPSPSDLVKAKSPDVDKALRARLEDTLAAMSTMVKRAETVEAYDQMIGEGNKEGNAVVQAAIDALLGQTKAIERAVATLDLKAIEFEGSDSLDNPEKVKG
ncbi:MAG: peptidase [Hyphomicrobiaceae bacterium]|nr:peptidase [Hyphomicrobiaceae bacterium]